MPSAGRTDLDFSDDKEDRPFFRALEDDDCSFFDMSYDFDGQARVGSSDASNGSNFFDEIGLSSASSLYSTDAFVPSSTKLSHEYRDQYSTEEQARHDRYQGMKNQQQQQQQQTNQEREQEQEQDFNQHLHQVKTRCESPTSSASDPHHETRREIRAVPVPIPSSQRLVHRFRPEGVCISQEDLLSIEGRFRGAPSQTLSPSRSRSPPLTPKQARSHTSPGTTPRTPREQSCRVNKLREARLHSCKPSMQPSHYYHAGLEGQQLASSDWSEEIGSFKQDPATPFEARRSCGLSLPLSPPPSVRVKQRPQFARHLDSPVSGSRVLETPSSPTAARCLGRVQRVLADGAHTLDMSEYTAHSYEHEELVSPVAPWMSETGGSFSFSPLSPMLDETASWTAPVVATASEVDTSFAILPCHKAGTDVQDACNYIQQSAYPVTSQGGLMIDFGSSETIDALGSHSAQSRDLDLFVLQGELDYSQERQDQSDGSHTCACVDATCVHGREGYSGTEAEAEANSVSDLQQQSGDKMWEAGIAAETRRLATADSSPGGLIDMSTRSRQLSGAKSLKRSSTATLSLDDSNAALLTRPSKMDARHSNGGGDARPTGKSSHGGSGDVFVNFTPSDSRKILTGVAPSGSSKTKARREKEAIERRRKLSEAAQRAVKEAGGDWERVAGELVEV